MRYLIFFLIVLSQGWSYGQELFPHTEPASTMPKGVFGFRFQYENYKELPSRRIRYWNGFRLMYGVNKNLTVMVTGTASNHHQRQFPPNLSYYFYNHHQKTYPTNPYLMEGINVYFKYRFFSLDGKQRHTRLALYGQACKAFVPHDEAETDLMADNSGVGGGIIATQLYKRFAISFTCGPDHAFLFKDKTQDVTFRSGDAWNYHLSTGYRLYPNKYSGYKDINVNIYAEFINRHYNAAVITENGKLYDFEPVKDYDPFIYNSLQENRYSELRTSLQFILNSNNRIDLGIAYPFLGRSYIHFYPMYFVNVQKYFYPRHRSKK